MLTQSWLLTKADDRKCRSKEAAGGWANIIKKKNKKKERREIELKMQMHVTEIFIPNSRCMLGPYFRLANHKQF